MLAVSTVLPALAVLVTTPPPNQVEVPRTKEFSCGSLKRLCVGVSEEECVKRLSKKLEDVRLQEKALEEERSKLAASLNSAGELPRLLMEALPALRRAGTSLGELEASQENATSKVIAGSEEEPWGTGGRDSVAQVPHPTVEAVPTTQFDGSQSVEEVRSSIAACPTLLMPASRQENATSKATADSEKERWQVGNRGLEAELVTLKPPVTPVTVKPASRLLGKVRSSTPMRSTALMPASHQENVTSKVTAGSGEEPWQVGNHDLGAELPPVALRPASRSLGQVWSSTPMRPTALMPASHQENVTSKVIAGSGEEPWQVGNHGLEAEPVTLRSATQSHGEVRYQDELPPVMRRPVSRSFGQGPSPTPTLPTMPLQPPDATSNVIVGSEEDLSASGSRESEAERPRFILKSANRALGKGPSPTPTLPTMLLQPAVNKENATSYVIANREEELSKNGSRESEAEPPRFILKTANRALGKRPWLTPALPAAYQEYAPSNVIGDSEEEPRKIASRDSETELPRLVLKAPKGSRSLGKVPVPTPLLPTLVLRRRPSYVELGGT